MSKRAGFALTALLAIVWGHKRSLRRQCRRHR